MKGHLIHLKCVTRRGKKSSHKPNNRNKENKRKANIKLLQLLHEKKKRKKEKFPCTDIKTIKDKQITSHMRRRIFQKKKKKGKIDLLKDISPSYSVYQSNPVDCASRREGSNLP